MLTHWLFPPGRGCEPGPHSVCDARGEGSGDHGQLPVPGEGRQTQCGQWQRLPHPVVPPQLYSLQVSAMRVTALAWQLGSYLSSLQCGKEILPVRRGPCQAEPRSSCPVIAVPQIFHGASPSMSHKHAGFAPQPVPHVCLIPFQLQGQGEHWLCKRHRKAAGEPQPVQHRPVPHRAGNGRRWIGITARRTGLRGVRGAGGWHTAKGWPHQAWSKE